MKKTRFLALLGVGIICINSFSGINVEAKKQSHGDMVKEKFENEHQNEQLSKKEQEIQFELNQDYQKLEEKMKKIRSKMEKLYIKMNMQGHI